MGQRGTVFAKTVEAQDYFDQTEFRLSASEMLIRSSPQSQKRYVIHGDM
jgi:hypothetical protein